MQSDFDSLRDLVRQFADERDWDKFHTPKNLATALTKSQKSYVQASSYTPRIRHRANSSPGKTPYVPSPSFSRALD
jgi:hypothetical protein